MLILTRSLLDGCTTRHNGYGAIGDTSCAQARDETADNEHSRRDCCAAECGTDLEYCEEHQKCPLQLSDNAWGETNHGLQKPSCATDLGVEVSIDPPSETCWGQARSTYVNPPDSSSTYMVSWE